MAGQGDLSGEIHSQSPGSQIEMEIKNGAGVRLRIGVNCTGVQLEDMTGNKKTRLTPQKGKGT